MLKIFWVLKNKNMKGVILAGGSGTRLRPLTNIISKQLLPIYDKPMIYYPISVLMLANIRDILIITTPNDIESYKKLLGDGSDFGLNFSYEIQQKPRGLADAFIIGEEFINGEKVCLILGDNIFYGNGLTSKLREATNSKNGAVIFGYKVHDPRSFGVVGLNKNNKVISINEKPENPESNIAVTGLYFYDAKVCDIAKKIKPSERGELEITEINKEYLKLGELNLITLMRGFTWLDTGTHSGLIDAGKFVETAQKTQGFMIACLEEIALSKGWLSKDNVKNILKKYKGTSYAEYLLQKI